MFYINRSRCVSIFSVGRDRFTKRFFRAFSQSYIADHFFFSIMPPKRRAPKPELPSTAPENENVQDSEPSKSKQTKKEKQEGAPPISSRVAVKRGTKLKSEDLELVENIQAPVKKQGRAKVESKKEDETVDKKDTSKKRKAPAVEDASKNDEKLAVKDASKNDEKLAVKDAQKKSMKKTEKTEVKEKKSDKITVKKDKKVLQEKSQKRVEKKDLPTKSEEPENKTNKDVTDWKAIKFDTEKKNQDGNTSNFKIVSWNVNGIRAWITKDGLGILEYDSPDILCVQETKCSDDQLPEELSAVEGYYKFWCSSKKKGYAGVGLFTKEEPINVTYGIGDDEQDVDGRCLTAEFAKFYLVNVYVPNAGRKLVTLDKRLEWNDLFKQFIKRLDQKKPVIICGDLNVAHNEIDLSNPKSNKRNAGFTDEEREGMTDFLQEGFIDSFRHLYPDQKDVYTFWTYLANARKKNVGWRLDYFLISKKLQKKLCDCVVLDKVLGSDHCPITLFITI